MILRNKVLSDNNIWIVACICLAAGMLLPMFTFSKLMIFNNTFSLLAGIFYFLQEGEIFLFFVVAAFSVLGPIYKLKLIRDLMIQKESDQEKKLKSLKKLVIVSKWSMADVFIIAVLVATVKLGMMASVSVHIGIVFFALAVVLSMVLVQRQMSGYEFRPKKETE
jgi:paraquat-inducible protein A